MTYIGSKGKKERAPALFALLVFALCAAAAYWALTALFPEELHQVGRWLQARFTALGT